MYILTKQYKNKISEIHGMYNGKGRKVTRVSREPNHFSSSNMRISDQTGTRIKSIQA